MLLNVVYDCKDFCSVNVDDRGTVEDLKCAILQAQNVSIEEQTLTFGGTTLENERCLNEYGLSNCCTVNLTLPITFHPKIQIYVKTPCNECFPLIVTTQDTVCEVKQQFSACCPVKYNAPEFVFESWLMEDERQLCGYGVEEGSMLNLVDRLPPGAGMPPIKVYIKSPSDQVNEFEFPQTMTVRMVKEAVSKCLCLRPGSFSLVYKGCPLAENATLYESCINHGAVICVVKSNRC